MLYYVKVVLGNGVTVDFDNVMSFSFKPESSSGYMNLNVTISPEMGKQEGISINCFPQNVTIIPMHKKGK